MECKIELIFVPVTDVDRAIEFYVDKVGACSIAFGEGTAR